MIAHSLGVCVHIPGPYSCADLALYTVVLTWSLFLWGPGFIHCSFNAFDSKLQQHPD